MWVRCELHSCLFHSVEVSSMFTSLWWLFILSLSTFCFVICCMIYLMILLFCWPRIHAVALLFSLSVSLLPLNVLFVRMIIRFKIQSCKNSYIFTPQMSKTDWPGYIRSSGVVIIAQKKRVEIQILLDASLAQQHRVC
jgi:hypothetical protein